MKKFNSLSDLSQLIETKKEEDNNKEPVVNVASNKKTKRYFIDPLTKALICETL